jgi:hypothetical protein
MLLRIGIDGRLSPTIFEGKPTSSVCRTWTVLLILRVKNRGEYAHLDVLVTALLLAYYMASFPEHY